MLSVLFEDAFLVVCVRGCLVFESRKDILVNDYIDV